MFDYFEWGNNVLEKGLSGGYWGGYFPIQYQLFALFSWVSRIVGENHWIEVYKIFNLVFEIGVFVLLVKLLDKLRINKNYSFMFWLHPWFLLTFSQGFVDAHFTFFVLLSTILLFDNAKKRLSGYVIAGAPFAIAFLLKPQILMLFFALIVFFVFISLRYKTWKNLMFFVPTLVLYFSYSAYFALKYFFSILINRNIHDLVYSLLILTNSYLATLNKLPCLTCSMPNIWYPIANILSNGQPVYMVTSRMSIAGKVSVETIVLLAVVFLIVHHCYLLLNAKNFEVPEKVLRLFLFTSLLVPFLMTGAHVNHPYLGTILLILYMAKFKNRLFRIAGNILLFALAGYLYGAYGIGASFVGTPNLIRQIPLVYFAFASIVGFAYVLFYLFKNALNKAD
jgi:hypothetical protein